MTLSRDSILFSADVSRSIIPVDVPEWGGTVNVRAMTGTERGAFEATNDTAPKATIRGRMAAATICDDSGALLFSQADVDALGDLSSVALDRVFEAAMQANGISSKAVEAEAKNS